MQYTAPEVFAAIRNKSEIINFKKQYSWDVGILMFIIAFGDLPFCYPSFGPVSFPRLATEMVGQEFTKIIGGLLEIEEAKRMGIEEAFSRMSALCDN